MKKLIFFFIALAGFASIFGTAANSTINGLTLIGIIAITASCVALDRTHEVWRNHLK